MIHNIQLAGRMQIAAANDAKPGASPRPNVHLEETIRMKRSSTTLKILGLVMVLSALTMVQANATGFGGYNHDWGKSRLTDWWSGVSSLLDDLKSKHEGQRWDWDCKWDWNHSWNWGSNGDCKPRPPQCVPEPSSDRKSVV